MTLTYQTSPTKDELLFTACATAINLDAVVGSVVVTPDIMGSASVPLSRWLRYQLDVTGSPSDAWDASFRIWIAANRGATPRASRGPAPSPPVRQNGKTCSCDATTGGSRPIAPPPRIARNAGASGRLDVQWPGAYSMGTTGGRDPAAP